MTLNQRFTSLLIPLIFLVGCSSSIEEQLYKQASRNAEKGKIEEALNIYEKLLVGFPESEFSVKASRSALAIVPSEDKNFVRQLKFLKKVILYSSDPEELLDTQRKIAEIQFEKMANYSESIKEFNKLLGFAKTTGEKFRYLLNLSKSFYYLADFLQSLVEVEAAIKLADNVDQIFEASLHKANIFMSQKKMDAAIEVFTDLQRRFPEKARKENLGINIAICYEDKRDYTKAVAALEDLKKGHPNPDFIDVKIQRLLKRKLQMPGASGKLQK